MKNVLLTVTLLALASCSSLPSPETAFVPSSGETETGGTPAAGEVFSGAAASDEPEIQKRAEEELPFLDTAIDEPLHEPIYALPEAELGGTERHEPETVNHDVVLVEPQPFEPVLSGLTEEETPPHVEPAPPAPPPAPPLTAAEPPTPPPPAVPAPAVVSPPAPPAAVKAPEKRSPPPPPPVTIATPPAPLPPRPERAPQAEPRAVRQPSAPSTATPVLPQTEAERARLDAPHRALTVTLGETAEVPFTGTGWVFLGEEGGQKGLNYLRRRASEDGQVFLFKPEAAGVYRLNFNRQDLLRGASRDEAVEVAVLLKSPVSPVPAMPQTTADAGADTGADAVADSLPVVETLAAVQSADTLLWNRGQELEAPGQTRDMKAALDLYRNLVRDYPESDHYTDSQKRIAYIERFFVNIR